MVIGLTGGSVSGRGLPPVLTVSLALSCISFSSYITESNLNNSSACCGFILSKHPDMMEGRVWVWEEEETLRE